MDWSLVVQAIIAIAGLIISAGVPLFIFQFKLFRGDMKELKRDVTDIGNKLDQHISNYDIHQPNHSR
jgi:hypothetical protein